MCVVHRHAVWYRAHVPDRRRTVHPTLPHLIAHVIDRFTAIRPTIALIVLSVSPRLSGRCLQKGARSRASRIVSFPSARSARAASLATFAPLDLLNGRGDALRPVRAS